MSLKARLRQRLEEHAPWLFALLLEGSARVFPNRGEPERKLLPLLCHRDELAVDVGANHGAYARAMVGLAGRLLAAEPNPNLARVLRWRLARALRDGRARVEEIAVSDAGGTIALRVPTGRSALASVEQAVTAGQGGRQVTVRRARIDDLALPRTGFVKIDVEGHEASVVRGALGLLARDQPNLLIEIEERHRPGSLQAIRRMLEPLGYRGFFLLDGRMQPIECFDLDQHQNRSALNSAGTWPLPGRTYIANFVFSARDDVVHRLAAWAG